MKLPFNIPADPSAEWKVIQQIIHQSLSERGVDATRIAVVEKRMKAAWDEMQFSHGIAVDDEQGVGIEQLLELHRAMQAHMTRLMFSRLLVEVELVKALHQS